MKELSLTHKIVFALLCVAAFTNTFTLAAHVTLIRVVLPVVLCILLFTERVRLDSSFYVVCSFFFTYITYTLLVTLCYGRPVVLPDIANFLFILLMVTATMWFFCAAPRDSLKILYWVCCANLVVSLVLATLEMSFGWHLPMSNINLPDKVMIVAEHNKNFPTGFFHNKNDFAIVVALTFCYLLAYRVHFIQNRKKWVDWVFLALCLAVLYMVKCRTAMVAVVIFLLFTQRQKLLKHKVFFGITGTVFLIGVVVTFFFVRATSTSIRSNLYLYSFASLFDSYGLGFGLGGDRYYFAGLDNFDLFESITNTHSYLMEFLLTSGIFFFVGYLLMLFYLMRRMARTKGRNEFWFMIPLYVFLLFSPSTASCLWIHYVFLGAIVGSMLMPDSCKTIEENGLYAVDR